MSLHGLFILIYHWYICSNLIFVSIFKLHIFSSLISSYWHHDNLCSFMKITNSFVINCISITKIILYHCQNIFTLLSKYFHCCQNIFHEPHFISIIRKNNSFRTYQWQQLFHVLSKFNVFMKINVCLETKFNSTMTNYISFTTQKIAFATRASVKGSGQSPGQSDYTLLLVQKIFFYL